MANQVASVDLVAPVEQLAKTMALVANPVRLSLLEQMRYPRTLAQLSAKSNSSYGAARPARNVSRQAIRQHVTKLVEGGLVRCNQAAQPTYVVDQPQTYALAQHLLQLSSQFEAESAEPGATMVWTGAPTTGRNKHGSRLVLVHGAYEGRSFPLSDSSENWSIGRGPDQDICLDYDPFVSRQHAAVIGSTGHHTLHDLGTNEERVQVNGTPVESAGHVRLSHGDIIRVGRSVLVYHSHS